MNEIRMALDGRVIEAREIKAVLPRRCAARSGWCPVSATAAMVGSAALAATDALLGSGPGGHGAVPAAAGVSAAPVSASARTVIARTGQGHGARPHRAAPKTRTRVSTGAVA